RCVGARKWDTGAPRTLGTAAKRDHHNLDPIFFPSRYGASVAAKAGYPSVQVPAGMISGVDAIATPDYPFGATFTGRAWSEPVLLRLDYAFEQATKERRKQPGGAPRAPGYGG